MECYSPPLLKEILSQDLWRRGHKKRWRMHWPRSKKDSRTIERRKTSRSPMPLFLSCLGDIAPCWIELCFMTPLVLRFITRSPWSHNSSGYSEWKRTFSNSNIKDDIAHQGKNFQTESILGAIKDDILLDNWTGQIHEGMSEIMMTWLEVDRHHVGYLLEISDTRALLGKMVDVCETATIWVDDRREPMSTLGWAWMMYKHYLGGSSRDLKQLRKGFRSSHLGEALSVGSGHALL
jgi:hypothetical protein